MKKTYIALVAIFCACSPSFATKNPQYYNATGKKPKKTRPDVEKQLDAFKKNPELAANCDLKKFAEKNLKNIPKNQKNKLVKKLKNISGFSTNPCLKVIALSTPKQKNK